MSKVPVPSEWETYVALGMKHAQSHFQFLSGHPQWFEQRVKAYLCGFVSGLARYGTARWGGRFTFSLMTGLADDALNRELPKGD